MKGTGTLLILEAPPPDLRDLTLLGPECRGGCGAAARPRPMGLHGCIPAPGSMLGSHSLRGPIPRPGASRVAEEGKPDISRANKTGHLDVLITRLLAVVSAPRDNVRFVPHENVRLTAATLGGGRPTTTTDDTSRTGSFGDVAQSAEEADPAEASRGGVGDQGPSRIGTKNTR